MNLMDPPLQSPTNSKAAKRYGALGGLNQVVPDGGVRCGTSSKQPVTHELNIS
jgi:hypothetical protein